jgi:hypothetical protein
MADGGRGTRHTRLNRSDGTEGIHPLMSTMRYKPSRPAAVLGIVVGIGMLAFGITQFRDLHGGALGTFFSRDDDAAQGDAARDTAPGAR